MKWCIATLLCLGLGGCAKQETTKTKTVTVRTSAPMIIHTPPPSGIISQSTCLRLKLGTSYGDIIKTYGWPQDPRALAEATADNQTYNDLQYPTDKTYRTYCKLAFKLSPPNSGSVDPTNAGRDLIRKELTFK